MLDPHNSLGQYQASGLPHSKVSYVTELIYGIPDLVGRIWKAEIIRENTVIDSSSQSVVLKFRGVYMLSCKLTAFSALTSEMK